MHLSEDATYQTRDGSRKGIRVARPTRGHLWSLTATASCSGPLFWFEDGTWVHGGGNHRFDLIEETPSTPPTFSFDACPVGKDGRRRAVTRGGNDVVLLCGDRNGDYPIVGYIEGRAPSAWRANGRVHSEVEHPGDLLLPPPSKRTVWVNLYEGCFAVHHATEAEAEASKRFEMPRLGNRAFPIEIDEATA